MTSDLFSPNDEMQQTFSVTELNRKVKDLLEIHFPLIWVEGEISNLSRPSSGHWYFTLKDQNAQVSCAMFKRRNGLVKFSPNVGDHLKLRARVSLYEGRGDYQLIVEHMEQAGFGLLQRRFEELKAKLHAEGLFDRDQKKDLPSQTQHLAVVTSASGAAIRDVLAVLERRFPATEITIIPSPVQGEDAPEKLLKAIKLADTSSEFDTILICRGGGSLEDLWAFNNEALARAIHACDTPIVSAVGHEVDFTIADFVADVRAATPSAAAELISADQNEMSARFEHSTALLTRRIHKQLEHYRERLTGFKKRLKHPRDKLDAWRQRLDQLEIRLIQAVKRKTNESAFLFSAHHEKFTRMSPLTYIQEKRTLITRLNQETARNMRNRFEAKSHAYSLAVARLDLVSPIATINRGYSIAKDEHGNILRSVDTVHEGEKISVQLSDGEITSIVKTLTKTS